MDLNEYLGIYAPCHDKIVNLIPDTVVRYNILSYLICRNLTPYDEVERLLNFDFFDQFDSNFKKLVALYSFVSNLRESEFWSCIMNRQEQTDIHEACDELLDMVDELIISSVMSLSGYLRIENNGYLIWTKNMLTTI